MELIYVTERLPFGNGEWQSYDTVIVASQVIAVRPSDAGCVITCRDGESFDTANDFFAIVERLQAA